MKKLFTLAILASCSFVMMQAQSLEELQAMKASKEEMVATKSAELEALGAEIASLTDQINLLSGWRTGLAGIVGLNFNNSNKWAGSPNPTSSSTGLNLSVTGFANRNQEKWFWNNKLIINKAWQVVNIGDQDGGELFDNGTVDILNLSSLYGYKLSDNLALSALGELNTSVENFLKPGTFDIGVGATWTPIPALVVVVHPFNYRITWPADGNASSQGALGAKIRADYGRDFLVTGKTVTWSSTLTSFLPYTDSKIAVVDDAGAPQEAGLFEFTWLNTISFTVWKGIGVGATFGVRKADFEVFENLQSFYSVGLSYAL